MAPSRHAEGHLTQSLLYPFLLTVLLCHYYSTYRRYIPCRRLKRRDSVNVVFASVGSNANLEKIINGIGYIKES